MDNSFGTILPGGTSEKAFIANLQPMLPLGQYVIDTLGHKYVYVTTKILTQRYNKNGLVGYFGGEYILRLEDNNLYMHGNYCMAICDVPSYNDLNIPSTPTKNIYLLAKVLEQDSIIVGDYTINDLKDNPQTIFQSEGDFKEYRQYIQTNLLVKAINAAGAEVNLTLTAGVHYFGKFKNINGIKTLIEIGPVVDVAATASTPEYFEPKGIPELNSGCEYFTVETDLVLNGTLNQENVGIFGLAYDS